MANTIRSIEHLRPIKTWPNCGPSDEQESYTNRQKRGHYASEFASPSHVDCGDVTLDWDTHVATNNLTKRKRPVSKARRRAAKWEIQEICGDL
jgi:hypothetical protein